MPSKMQQIRSENRTSRLSFVPDENPIKAPLIQGVSVAGTGLSIFISVAYLTYSLFSFT